jgi:hypothetical protein
LSLLSVCWNPSILLMNQIALVVLLLLFDNCDAFVDDAVNTVSDAGKAGVQGTVALGNTVATGTVDLADTIAKSITSMFTFGSSPDSPHIHGYHSPDKEVIALKQRMLADANLRDPRASGGIRARLKNETVEIPAATSDVFKLAKAASNLSIGSAKFTAILDGVSEQYPEIIRALNQYRDYFGGQQDHYRQTH